VGLAEITNSTPVISGGKPRKKGKRGGQATEGPGLTAQHHAKKTFGPPLSALREAGEKKPSHPRQKKEGTPRSGGKRGGFAPENLSNRRSAKWDPRGGGRDVRRGQSKTLKETQNQRKENRVDKHAKISTECQSRVPQKTVNVVCCRFHAEGGPSKSG